MAPPATLEVPIDDRGNEKNDGESVEEIDPGHGRRWWGGLREASLVLIRP